MIINLKKYNLAFSLNCTFKIYMNLYYLKAFCGIYNLTPLGLSSSFNDL